MNIVFCAPGKNPQPWLDELSVNLPEARVWAWSVEQAPGTTAAQADYAVVWAPPPALFQEQRRLQAVFNIGAGADGVMKLESLPRDIPVVRLNDAGMAVQMAEYVCHALIRHAREFDVYAEQAAASEWSPRPAIDRAAWPVGVMGLGSIGARVAGAIAGFEYPVFGWSRAVTTLPGVGTFAGAGQMDAFLRAVRVLVCLLPLTPETEAILNRHTLSKLKPGAYLINVARGRHLVEQDLLELLDSGALAGATLDVAGDEPLSSDHAFWRHPKITITPHISAITLLRESVAQVAQKIRALQRGDTVDGVVERARGY
ncbi:MAG TPA: glyoxylate/hydroxypyruvate reductase A [Usitatibacteraceae bacterium]